MIYFVRHGETDFNLFNISQGQMNTSLNRTGLKQAKEVVEKFKDIKIDYIFSSTLNRAVQTAEEINKIYNLPIIFDQRLVEMSKGNLQGNINSQKKYDKFYKNPHKFGGETKLDVYTRVKAFWDDIQKYKGKNILIVSHGVIYRFFKFCYENKDFKKEDVLRDKIDNCEIKQFEF